MIRGPLHILLVEDSPLDAALISEQLRSAAGENPLRLTRAETMAEAGQMLREEAIDCILLDLTLPDAAGLEALGQLHYVAPDIPIVVFSGVEGEELAVRAVAEGAQDYLVKGQAPGPLVLRSVRYAVERKQTELQLAELALTDALTGLPNRTRLMDRVAHALDRTSRTRTIVALLFLDLDRFKLVNDSLGHTAGDRLLYTVAERLRGAVRPADTVARFGGDEFVVLCEDLNDATEAEIVVGRIHDALEAPVNVDGHDIVPSASIGVAVSRSSADSPDRLLRDADAAMYRAKAEGRGHAHFAEEMHEGAQQRLKLEAELHRALRAGELELHYQPQIDLTSRGRTIVGAEALLRWKHPRRGLIGPGEFISAAEDTGLIRPIGAWVLREACRQLAAWDAAGIGGGVLEMSVNLSPRQLTADLAGAVREALEVNGLAPGRLCLEITESVLLDPSNGAAERVRELRDLGVRIALDDFGTGYASLSLLTEVKIDTLKIDRSFVQEMVNSEASHRIVNAVAGLAQALGLDVVAEGVEDLSLAGDLAGLGCGRAQGFAFARPVAPEEFASMVTPPARAPENDIRVFLCDDAPDLRHLLRVSLEEDLDLRVTGEAGDGEKIVERVRAVGADVVLMDLSMPRVDGLEAVAALRTAMPNIGIVVLSGFEQERMRSRAIAMGADCYVEKRAPLEAIRQAVRDIAATHRAAASMVDFSATLQRP